MTEPLEPAITGPGIYELDAEYYHSDCAPKPSMSSGFLSKIITETVAVAKEGHPRLGPPKSEDDKIAEREKKYDLGTVAHAVVLGAGREIVFIDAPDWKTKAAQEARKTAFQEGKTPCLSKTFAQAQAMREALFLQLADMPDERETFVGGQAEVAGFWQEPVMMGDRQRTLWGRALYDWIDYRDGRLIVRDYKTYNGQTGADPEGFVKGLISTGRDIQDPWYSRGAAAIHKHTTGDDLTWADVDYKFIVQDPNPPYLAVVVALDDRAWSNERLQWAIDRWAAAAGAGLYRGHAPLTHYVPPPTYARIQWDERMMREWEFEQTLLEEGRKALQLRDPSEYQVPNPDDIKGSEE